MLLLEAVYDLPGHLPAPQVQACQPVPEVQAPQDHQAVQKSARRKGLRNLQARAPLRQGSHEHLFHLKII